MKRREGEKRYFRGKKIRKGIDEWGEEEKVFDFYAIYWFRKFFKRIMEC